MESPGSGPAPFPPQDARKPSTDSTIVGAMSRSNTSHWQREEQDIEGDFAIFKSPVDIEPSYPLSWYLRPSTLDWPPCSRSTEQWQTERRASNQLLRHLIAPNPYSEYYIRGCDLFQYSLDDFANACAETPSIDFNILDPTPPSQDLPPLHFHFRSNQHRPRLLLFNHLSKLWLPLRQDRFLVLLSYLLGGTRGRDVSRYTLALSSVGTSREPYHFA